MITNLTRAQVPFHKYYVLANSGPESVIEPSKVHVYVIGCDDESQAISVEAQLRKRHDFTFSRVVTKLPQRFRPKTHRYYYKQAIEYI